MAAMKKRQTKINIINSGTSVIDFYVVQVALAIEVNPGELLEYVWGHLTLENNLSKGNLIIWFYNHLVYPNYFFDRKLLALSL